MFNGIIKNTGKVSGIYKKDNNCYIEVSSKMKFTTTSHNLINGNIILNGLLKILRIKYITCTLTEMRMLKIQMVF